ncbi:hypothetical protein TRICHSKD4_2637 [Roseibium sp. TrichSKD4]|uniref:hypothetical protein n=1 Tax=Roseibium sp. TrichSKD4 TaxID=744980 RepID=UPI0001E56F06|nr:hypothetical protein [Roseibium sp. TrichSKD4]EFO32048.1 hypothetical protein TRICHSKD4_2637 [Roseibium sp. TrichSKD4]
MNKTIGLGFLFVVLMSAPSFAGGETSTGDTLAIPSRGLEVDLETGNVRLRGVEGQCLEKVSKAGPHVLVVEKRPGDDRPSIMVDGTERFINANKETRARLGSVHLTKTGDVFALRQWKTGAKQTELLQNANVVLSWPRNISAKLIRVDDAAIYVLEASHRNLTKLVSYALPLLQVDEHGSKTLIDFKGCHVDRLRLRKQTVWAKLECDDQRGAGIFKIPLATGIIEKPLLSKADADFISLPKRERRRAGETFLIAAGSQSALHFFRAVNGLMLSQTGEVRACSSDAEGLQSWNQSYRLQALSLLYEKTGDNTFAQLASKSIRLTLAAQDGLQERAGPNNPECGWSSTIYGGGHERLSLLINQAVIANALSSACSRLGSMCSYANSQQITKTLQCLKGAYEPNFDAATGLYRIADKIDFRFAGKVAPWNWQMSFAALLGALSEDKANQRAQQLADRFLDEWDSDDQGSLWRYWPEAYYLEKGLEDRDIKDQRFEDVGHAGISLLALKNFKIDDVPDAVRARLDHLLSFKPAVPCDLDGDGPPSPRWFPAGGWADYASDSFAATYADPVPRGNSADRIYARARLMIPTLPLI